MLSQDLSTAKAALHSAKTVVRVNDIYRRAMLAFGFTSYAVGYVPVAPSEGAGTPSAPFLLLNWPKHWLELYAREGLASDDILLAEAARTLEPFTWSEVRARYPGASERAFALAAEFGWTDGFVVPVHNPLAAPHEQFGVVSLASPALKSWTTARREAAVAVSLTAFARARSLKDVGTLQTAANLSGREREALAMVADGLGDAEIAANMAVSASTAHYHVERAKTKLKAATRAQAVAVAIMQGLV